MKKIILLFVVLLTTGLILSCLGLPQPADENESLVVGSLIMDYPDGFFRIGSMTFRNGIKLNIVNLATKNKFSVKTSNGYFRFIANGQDGYLVRSYELIYVRGNWTYTCGPYDIGIRIPDNPHKVFYLGHVTELNTLPEFLDKKSSGGNTTTTSYDYKTEIIVDKDIEDIKLYLADSEWLSYDIVDLSDE